MFGVDIRQEGGGPVQGPGQSWSICVCPGGVCLGVLLLSVFGGRSLPWDTVSIRKQSHQPLTPLAGAKESPSLSLLTWGSHSSGWPCQHLLYPPAPYWVLPAGVSAGVSPQSPALPPCSCQMQQPSSNGLQGKPASPVPLWALAPGPQAMWALRGSLGLLAGPCSSTPRGRFLKGLRFHRAGAHSACPCDTRLRQGPRLAGRAGLKSLTAVPRLELLSSAPSSVPKDPHFA